MIIRPALCGAFFVSENAVLDVKSRYRCALNKPSPVGGGAAEGYFYRRRYRGSFNTILSLNQRAIFLFHPKTNATTFDIIEHSFQKICAIASKTL